MKHTNLTISAGCSGTKPAVMSRAQICNLKILCLIASYIGIVVSGLCTRIDVQSSRRYHGFPSNHPITQFTTFLHGSSGNEDEPEFDPLDVMLAKARKRGVNPLLRVQAFADKPIWKTGIILTRGDVVFTIVALFIGAKGFALGLLVGKWTQSKLPFRQDLPPLVVQLYPVLLAIGCDLLI